MKMTRNEFLKSMAAASVAFTSTGTYAALSKTYGIETFSQAQSNYKLGASIYSWSRDLRVDNATVESVMADISDMGGEYVELLAGQDVPGYPNPSEAWVNQWHSWLDKYNLKPSAYDLYTWAEFFRDRRATQDEVFDLLVTDLKLAKRLGFPWIRMQVPSFPEDAPANLKGDELTYWLRERQDLKPGSKKFLERATRYAEDNGLKLAIELHAPITLDSSYVKGLVDLIEEMKTKNLGFNVDFSIFMWRPARATVEGLIQQGAKPEIIEYIIQAYRDRLGAFKTIEEVKKMGGGKVEQDYASDAGIFDQSYSDPKELKTIAPYIIYSHAKFYDMMEDLTEYSIPYTEILQEFKNNKVECVLSSEYEGRNPDYSVSTAIRLQHAMMRNILGLGHKV
jgi:sugar phosphate isomerase/epimerase